MVFAKHHEFLHSILYSFTFYKLAQNNLIVRRFIMINYEILLYDNFVEILRCIGLHICLYRRIDLATSMFDENWF
jgi:hypothetical protein